LAAPQVGESKMLFLIDWMHLVEEDGGIKPYINPEVVETGDSTTVEKEGCLSLPEIWAEVRRADRIKVRYTTLEGVEVAEELTGMPARVFLHEYDHLLGILFIDRISRSERARLKSGLQAILDGTVKPFDGSMPMEDIRTEGIPA